MAMEVKIPSLGESITSGILSTWHVASGDFVESGQQIYDLETDKITSEGTAEASGVIQLKVDEGDEVEIGAVVAVIDTEAEKPQSDAAEKDGKQEASGGAEDTAKDSEKDEPEDARQSGENQKEASSEDSGDADDSAKPDDSTVHPASVRRIAAESGIDPDKVEGSGKKGRVTKADMLKAAEQKEDRGEKQEPQSEAAPRGKPESRKTRKKMTPLRRTIANRLVEAQQSSAMLTTFNEVDMSKVMGFRKLHQETFVAKHGVKLGFMSFFTKAVVLALKEVPAVNAQIDGDEIVTNHYYDIGVAVSTPKGLMVPVLRDCDKKSFAAIEKDLIDYANRAKDGKIGIDDLQGGVFTISNGGIFGSMLSTPILNSPQSAILGMHTIQERAVVVDGEIVIRPMMYLALSYDHRIIDGREAVGFLVQVKKTIEDPTRLLFEI